MFVSVSTIEQLILVDFPLVWNLVQSLVVEVVTYLNEYMDLALEALDVGTTDDELFVVEGVELLEVVKTHLQCLEVQVLDCYVMTKHLLVFLDG